MSFPYPIKKPFKYSENLRMNELQKDILTATMFIIGLVGFISGEFIISSALFASAAITSNVNPNYKRAKAGQFSYK